MHQSIGKILPSDHFTIINQCSITDDHYQALYQLYQPIIGVDATALYVTLYHLIQANQKHSHHHLMQLLDRPLTVIYQARLKCEAIGLIHTYKHELEHGSIYHYQLNEPLTVKQFLKHDLLTQLLRHQIGRIKYQAIKESVSSIFDIQDKNQLGKNVTAHFSDVFKYDGAAQSFVKINQEAETQAEPNVQYQNIDWKWLEKSLADRMLPVERILTDDNIKLIEQMGGLYQLSTTQLDKAIQWALTSQHDLNREEFKNACLDLVETLPAQQVNIVNQRERIKQTDQEPKKSKRDLFVERMETISPKELLEDLSSGRQASQQDLKMIANIMDAQGLEPGVMNVLIHYVMLKTDMKLTRSYLEKIASHWSRKNVKTVQQAMTLAKSENNKYQQWDQKKQTNYGQRRKSQEVVPEWFKNRKKKEDSQPAEVTADIDQILQSFKNKN
ncbi:MAG: replication initiation and membrane attachment protein [Amphibacillus sp.]|nr:replication initiation and membrane attachment protein [Amphibacillus sp.]